KERLTHAIGRRPYPLILRRGERQPAILPADDPHADSLQPTQKCPSWPGLTRPPSCRASARRREAFARTGLRALGGRLKGRPWRRCGCVTCARESCRKAEILALLQPELFAQDLCRNFVDRALRELPEMEGPERDADQPVHFDPEMLHHPAHFAVLAFLERH